MRGFPPQDGAHDELHQRRDRGGVRQADRARLEGTFQTNSLRLPRTGRQAPAAGRHAAGNLLAETLTTGSESDVRLLISDLKSDFRLGI